MMYIDRNLCGGVGAYKSSLGSVHQAVFPGTAESAWRNGQLLKGCFFSNLKWHPWTGISPEGVTTLFACFYVFCFVFLGPHPWHLEVPRLGVELELQPLAYARTTATRDPSCICNLHHSSRQHQILNPLRESRD